MLSKKETAITFQDLEELFSQICDEANFSHTDLFSSEKWAKEDKYKCKKDGSFPEINTSTALMNSFYTREILKVMESPGDLVSSYGVAIKTFAKPYAAISY